MTTAIIEFQSELTDLIDRYLDCDVSPVKIKEVLQQEIDSDLESRVKELKAID